MEAKKLNQNLLMKVCYILGSYDLTPSTLLLSPKHCHIILSNEYPYVPIYVLAEIQELGLQHFGLCRIGDNFAIIFEKEEGSNLHLSEVIQELPE